MELQNELKNQHIEEVSKSCQKGENISQNSGSQVVSNDDYNQCIPEEEMIDNENQSTRKRFVRSGAADKKSAPKRVRRQRHKLS